MAAPVSNVSPNSQSLAWLARGPRPGTEGQVEGIFDREIVGAIQAIAAHPVEPDIVYVGAVNGGIWRTANAMSASPTWQQLSDEEMSLSIGALEFDPTDDTHQTLVAGTGRFSSMSRSGGALIGLLRTADGGVTWSVHDAGGSFRRVHISGVAPRGATIVVATNNAGLFRSTDTGSNWVRVSGTPGTNLPAGAAFDLAGDPTDPSRLFTHAGAAGFFRSTDTGATWAKVSNAAMDAVLGFTTDNVRISVGVSDNVYVAIANSGHLAGLFRSGDGGSNWTALDLPLTFEANGDVFDLHPGGQAGIHLSLSADRNNANLVYIGGDRQPGFDEGPTGALSRRFPNSIGARDYSGRLFRIDAAQQSGNQSTHLTHSNTASDSAPHADSRDIVFASNGVILEADDGGVYRRTRPDADDGDWFSMNGNLQTTEFHSVAWDANSHTVIGGAQDTGTPQQDGRSDDRWRSVSTGDGGTVAVDATSTPGLSTRYSSFQFLGNLRREVYDAAGSMQSRTRVALLILGGGQRATAQFYTPIELNNVTATRLIVGAQNGVYESDDQGDTVTAIRPNVRVNRTGPIAYGATGNEDMLYVGSGRSVFVRTAAHPAVLTTSTAYPGTASVVGIAINPDDPQSAFVIDSVKVYRTEDAGAQWEEITNNLAAAGAAVLRSVVYCGDLGAGSVVIGTNTGIFAAEVPNFTTWSKLGTGLPIVPVLRLQYSQTDRLLLAGTFGRGAWTLTLPEEAIV